MTGHGTRSLWTVLAATVVIGFAASLIGCASAGPQTPIAVSDIKSVAGTWEGVLYTRGFEPDHVKLTIREDGTYDVVSRQPIGGSHGRGTVTISQGRLVFQGEKGRGVGTLLTSPGGDRVMNVEATLSDNTLLSAKLSPTP